MNDILKERLRERPSRYASETEEQFIARMEKWSEPGSDADRLFALARRGAASADRIAQLEAALREIIADSFSVYAIEVARAALGEDRT